MDASLGFDIGGGSLTVGLVKNNEITHEKTVKTPSNLLELAELILKLIDEISDAKNVKIGLGLPAYFESNGELTFPNIKGNTKEFMETLIKYEGIFFGNDADCTAYGLVERLDGIEKIKCGGNVESEFKLICITLGTGIGGGAVILKNGRNTIYNENGRFEPGHINLGGSSKLCGCGKFGCVETIVSCQSIEKEWVKLGREKRDAKEIDLLSQNNDSDAVEIFLKAGNSLGLLCTHLVGKYNPQNLVFAGGGANSPVEGVFFSKTLDVMREKLGKDVFNNLFIGKTPDAKTYGVLGAAQAALEGF